jgi:YD repeat-containing protein
MVLSSYASTSYIYDDLGRLTEINRPNGDRTIFTYDQAGNIINISVITIDAIEIHTADDLHNIRNNLAGSFRLVSDIDMNGIDWTPIGTRTAPFTGVIDGDGYIIHNLTIDNPHRDDVGLFGRNSGTIINLGLTDINITGANNTGAIAGTNTGNIIGSFVNGNSIITGNNDVGGITGINSGGILKTYSTSTVHGVNNTGGFVGTVTGGNIDQAYATGYVYGNNNVAGFVGHITDSASVLRNAFSTGQVTGVNNNAGFVGQITSGRIENCYSISNNTNGFKGTNSGAIENSYFDKDIIDLVLTAPEARTTIEMMSESNYTNWDFINIWEIEEGVSYPILSDLPPPNSSNPNINADVLWLTFDLIKNENESENEIRTDLYLPKSTINNAVITWTSSNPDIITNTGIVLRPAFGDDPVELTLTATFRHGFETGKVIFTLTVEPKSPQDAQRPIITHQPENTTALTNESVYLSVSATVNSGVLSYQWYEHIEHDDIKLESEIEPIYYPPTLSTGERMYYVVITNTDTTATGSSVSSVVSESATVTVTARNDAETPLITGYSNDFIVPIGGTAVLTAAAEVSRGNLTYQWYERTEYGDTPVFGETQPAFIAPTHELGQRQYFVIITNTDITATGIQTAETTGDIITVDVNESALFHNVTLSVNSVHQFPDQNEGYNYADELPILITNTGLDDVTGLNVKISGGDINAFNVTVPEQTSLHDDLSTSFTVTPTIGLTPRNYISIISVTGDNNVLVSFVASFTVTADNTTDPPDVNDQSTNYTITATSGANGIITPSGDVLVRNGENRTYTITPDYGYAVSNVLVDGISIGSINSYTFINVTSNHRIHAAFAPNNTTGVNNTGGNNIITPPLDNQPGISPKPTTTETPKQTDNETPSAEITVNGKKITAQADENGVYRFILTDLTPNKHGEVIIVIQESNDKIYIHVPISALGTNDLIITAQTSDKINIGSLRLQNSTLESFKQKHGNILILSLSKNNKIEIEFEKFEKFEK